LATDREEAREPSLLSLSSGEAHLWYARTAAVAADAARLDACRALLADDERARAARFVFDRDRRLFIVAHALVRCTLSRYAPVPPQAWRFAAGSHGRPRISGPLVDDLDFNLSHSAELAACLVARGMVLGVDVECVAREAPLAVADHYFAPAEVAALTELPAAGQPRRFFELWTLKESYIKARGLGLSLPLDRFAFALDDGAAPTISFVPPIEDDPGAWRFSLLEPAPQYLAATALRPPPGVAPRVLVREAALPDA
jgi:4'-phosphopantetheinyl transferase